jgi:mediator of RNA polymerase II transcription subunit 10
MSEKVSRFEALEQQLELFIETTRQVGIIVSDVQPNGQAVLNKKL